MISVISLNTLEISLILEGRVGSIYDEVMVQKNQLVYVEDTKDIQYYYTNVIILDLNNGKTEKLKSFQGQLPMYVKPLSSDNLGVTILFKKLSASMFVSKVNG